MSKQKQLTSREKSAQTLAAAFGVSNSRVATTSRSKTLNIAAFLASGMVTERLTFNEAAEMIRKDGIVETDKGIDRMLARKGGVTLSNGTVLRDVWSKNSIATKYDD